MDGYGTQETISSLSKDISDTAIRGNSIYTIVDGPGWTWKEAQSEATSIGGNLVTINDELENQFLVDNLDFKIQ